MNDLRSDSNIPYYPSEDSSSGWWGTGHSWWWGHQDPLRGRHWHTHSDRRYDSHETLQLYNDPRRFVGPHYGGNANHHYVRPAPPPMPEGGFHEHPTRQQTHQNYRSPHSWGDSGNLQSPTQYGAHSDDANHNSKTD